MARAEVLIEADNREILIKFPITRPTSKIRVKRRKRGFGEPVATRQDPMLDSDYIEWQIGYDTKDIKNPTVVRELIVPKTNEIRYGNELSKIIWDAKRIEIFNDDDFDELEKFINNINDTDTLEENEKIVLQKTKISVLGGFMKAIQKVPMFIKNNGEYFVEIKLSHKQRAVGFQAMIYLCIWLRYCEDDIGNQILNRTAEAKEICTYKIDKSKKDLIKDVIKAFAIASKKHRHDIGLILQQVKGKCN